MLQDERLSAHIFNAYDIARDLERINIISERALTPKLRRENRIKTIHSSLWIEANTLTLSQVGDVIEGKKVIGPEKDIKEAKNAYFAYQKLLERNPYDVKELLASHKILMEGLTKDGGRFRDGNVGVFAGKVPIHVAPQAFLVPELMGKLMNWVKNSDLPQVVKSCIFHYEFEFIHPFSDGNGRMGRMWQTLLLYQENTLFGWLPVEELVAANQQEYYSVINESITKNNSAIFAQFMLSLLAQAVREFRERQDKYGTDLQGHVLVNVPENVRVNETEKMILFEIRNNPHIKYDELSKKINKTEKTVQRTISTLKNKNLIERVGSDKVGYWKIKNENNG